MVSLRAAQLILLYGVTGSYFLEPMVRLSAVLVITNLVFYMCSATLCKNTRPRPSGTTKAMSGKTRGGRQAAGYRRHHRRRLVVVVVVAVRTMGRGRTAQTARRRAETAPLMPPAETASRRKSARQGRRGMRRMWDTKRRTTRSGSWQTSPAPPTLKSAPRRKSATRSTTTSKSSSTTVRAKQSFFYLKKMSALALPCERGRRTGDAP